MTPGSVTVHIERLVLEGVHPHDRRAVAAAFERELTSAIEQRGMPPSLAQSQAIPHVRASLASPPPRPAGARGAAIAGAVYRGLAR